MRAFVFFVGHRTGSLIRSCRPILLCLVSVNAAAGSAGTDDPVLLWPEGAPGATGAADADRPALWVYEPAEDPNGAAIIICPGGGYAVHAVDHEGTQPARWFNRLGGTAFVLRYRLAPYRHPIPLSDVQRALRYVRSHAERWNVDPQRIGVMGFSAGGHLASSAATHFDSGNPDAADPVARVSSRPDFAVLGYPVISLQPGITHGGSVRNLLGDQPTPELREQLSGELQVTADTPPVFLFHTLEDSAVRIENSLRFAEACRDAGVPFELHAFQHGQHGVGLANGHPALAQWIELAGTWLRQTGQLTDQPRQAVRGTVTRNGEPFPWGSIAFESEDPTVPTGWSMIMRGRFAIPDSSGLVPGEYRVRITDMGDVQPVPTLEDARLLDDSLIVVISPGQHELEIAF